MSRTERQNHPATVAYYQGSPYGIGWSQNYEEEEVFSRPTLPDGKATQVPGGKKFKQTFRRIERSQVAQALREEDWLTASAPEKRCLWKNAWY